VRIRSRHTFGRRTIVSRWTVRCRRTCGIRAYFPTWGSAIVAVRRDGRRVRLDGASQVRLGAVRRVRLGGYRISRLRGPRGGRLFAAPVKTEPTNPKPGPSLAVQVRRRGLVRLSAMLEPTG
jgi:hypothetical protein